MTPDIVNCVDHVWNACKPRVNDYNILTVNI